MSIYCRERERDSANIRAYIVQRERDRVNVRVYIVQRERDRVNIRVYIVQRERQRGREVLVAIKRRLKVCKHNALLGKTPPLGTPVPAYDGGVKIHVLQSKCQSRYTCIYTLWFLVNM